MLAQSLNHKSLKILKIINDSLSGNFSALYWRVALFQSPIGPEKMYEKIRRSE
tara:strand:- start:909 stop:1067 length:159 start_codon:yes stop_codon:yes gene_type:complete